MGCAGDGAPGPLGERDPHPLLPGHRAHEHRRRVTRVARGLVLALAAWLVAFAVHTAEPAGYDFIALYATARLVATGHGGEGTDPAAPFALEPPILSERTGLLLHPNVPSPAPPPPPA